MERGDFKSKFELCVLTTQSGKTFTAISKIDVCITQDRDLGRSIHLIFTMNTLLNNAQVSKRLKTIEETYGKGSICVFSSKYDGVYKHVKSRHELQSLCFDEVSCPRVVVMCSNSRRYDDGMEFLRVINRNKTNFVRAFAYFDELHKYLSPTLRSQIEEVHDLDIVFGITALTATPDKIFTRSGFWSKIQLVQLDNFTETNYAGANDMIFNCIDDFFPQPYTRPRSFDELDRQTVDYVSHVLESRPTILQDDSFSFIPAHVRRTGHSAIRNLVFRMNENAVVVVVNGEEKTLQYKVLGNTKTIPIMSLDEEVCETISKIVSRFKLNGRPIVVTGFLCVGMGQTLTHETLGSFSSAIIGHMDLTNDEIYQLFGRITGRMKGWETYRQTEVYCPTVIMNRCIVMEECARNMAVEHNGDIVSQKDYIEPMTEMGMVGKDAIENIRVAKIKSDEELAAKAAIKLDKELKKQAKQEEKNARERSKSIPYIIDTTPENIREIQALHTRNEKKARDKLISEIVEELDAECFEKIQTYTLVRVVIPEINTETYTNNITKAIVAHSKGKKFITALQKKDKNKDLWTCNIDLKDNKIIILTQKRLE